MNLTKAQIDELLRMSEEEFQRWCLTIERLRYVYWKNQEGKQQ